MGKKSKRKSNNNKPLPCYHGCLTKKNFQFGEHYKVLERWDDHVGKNGVVGGSEFYKTNKRVMDDPTFSCFVMAHVTDDFLKGKDDDTLRLRLWLLLLMRYLTIPEHEGKDAGLDSEYMKNYLKYSRDIATKRGRIKCMAREIPCDCMEEKRVEAQSMDKVAMCHGCYEDFPKVTSMQKV